MVRDGVSSAGRFCPRTDELAVYVTFYEMECEREKVRGRRKKKEVDGRSNGILEWNQIMAAIRPEYGIAKKGDEHHAMGG